MKSVVACIDGSPNAKGVCDAAAWASKRLEASLTLLHVLEKTVTPGNENFSGAIGLGAREHLLTELTELDEKRSRVALEHGKHMLDDARLRVEQQGVADVHMQQRHGALLEEILELQEKTRLLVMGRLGEDHLVQVSGLGSHLENVARAVSSPVLVSVGEFTQPKKYMIAYDGSDTANLAISRIASSPLLRELEGNVVMVGSDNEGRLISAAQILLEQGYSVKTHLLEGDIPTKLKEFQVSHNIDLLVMGAYGHSRIRQLFLGSNTSKMVSKSTIPLLLLR